MRELVLLWLFLQIIELCYGKPELDSQYIIVFRQFSAPENHLRSVRELLDSLPNCSWRHTNRLRSRRSTDFIVLNSLSCPEIQLEILSGNSKIKHAVKDRMRRREPLVFDSQNIKSGARNSVEVVKALKADELWNLGFRGKGVRVGIFDTGLNLKHPHFRRNIRLRMDWTDEGTEDDLLGHGTFVAGIIGADPERLESKCRGLAPEAELYIYRVFNSKQESYTSWFLDAFNHAMEMDLDVINFSIGGPDYLDIPFVEKIQEVSSKGIVVVSAIGNDGPGFGTLNSPGDQIDVIGVGGAKNSDDLASFSSRGMTTWEIPHGYGRVKPDIVAYSHKLIGSSRTGSKCTILSGTSFASPIVSGAVALLISSIPNFRSNPIFSPASIRQALIESANPLTNENISLFEQGAGLLNLINAYKILLTRNAPKIALFPSNLDLRAEKSEHCTYFWPLCAQPLYPTSLPLVINFTVLNGIGVSSKFFENPTFISDDAQHEGLLELAYSYPKLVWPWSGFLGIRISVTSSFKLKSDIIVSGKIIIQLQDIANPTLVSLAEATLSIRVITTPDRSRRIIWDQFHNLNYPSGFFPKDDLEVSSLMLIVFIRPSDFF